MHRLFLAIAALTLFVLPSCHGAPRLHKDFGQGAYYTRYSLFEERGLHRTTNYRRGTLVPINTQVTLLDAGRDRFKVRVESSGRNLVIENDRRHTDDSLEQAFDRVLSPQPIDLSAFPPEQQQAIQEGKAIVGMAKDAVLLAMGPPPESGTPSRDSNQWRYWDTRMTSFVVTFDANGMVADPGR